MEVERQGPWRMLAETTLNFRDIVEQTQFLDSQHGHLPYTSDPAIMSAKISIREQVIGTWELVSYINYSE